MKIISVGIRIIFRGHSFKTYRAGTDRKIEMKDLLKDEIENIAKEYKFEDIISIKFTG